VLVDPEATEVGPVSVTVGTLVLLLWHEVQLDPLIPEKPEMPLPVALAAAGQHMGISSKRAIHNQRTAANSLDVLSLDF
jgi:hypothetical protein